MWLLPCILYGASSRRRPVRSTVTQPAPYRHPTWNKPTAVPHNEVSNPTSLKQKRTPLKVVLNRDASIMSRHMTIYQLDQLTTAPICWPCPSGPAPSLPECTACPVGICTSRRMWCFNCVIVFHIHRYIMYISGLTRNRLLWQIMVFGLFLWSGFASCCQPEDIV